MKPVSALSNDASKPDYNSDKCYQAKDHDEADLCAQWRAAIAAEKAADTAWWGNIVGSIAAALSFASVVLVLFALRQTERSLKIAQRERASATRRAIEAKNEAKASHDLSVSQTIAYVVVQKHALVFDEKRSKILGIRISIKNVGNTPAFNCKVAHDIFVYVGTIDGLSKIDPIQWDKLPPKIFIGADVSIDHFTPFGDVQDGNINILNQPDVFVISRGVVFYNDVFGKSHSSHFSYNLTNEAAMMGVYFSASPKGNGLI